MPLLTGVVLYEDGERRTLPGNRKIPATYETLYVAKRINAEEQEVLKKYYLCKSARRRLQTTASFPLFLKRAKRARRTLDILASFEKSGVCIPAKIWWKDKGTPKHPFSVIQERMFREPLNRPNMIDITGGLGFWLSERGCVKNNVVHAAVDNIVIGYLEDTMPRYKDASKGLLSDEMQQAVVAEICHRAETAVMSIVAACAQYGALGAIPVEMPNLVALGERQAKEVSAEAQARAWMGTPPSA